MGLNKHPKALHGDVLKSVSRCVVPVSVREGETSRARNIISPPLRLSRSDRSEAIFDCTGGKSVSRCVVPVSVREGETSRARNIISAT